MAEHFPADVLDRYNVSRESLTRLRLYVEALVGWQKRMNLVGPSTVENVWTRHILDGLQVLPLLPTGTTSIADLGSGGGIPGLVVAIATGMEAHLYESNGKKAAFLRHAARLTGTTAIVHQGRLEGSNDNGRLPKVQAVLARAFARLPELLGYAEPFLKEGAIGFFHKGRDVDIELTEATKYWKIQTIKHPSTTDSRGVILEVREVWRV
jgi:16S rRNA (guanine527-N7)-methyltransferase